MKKKSFIIDDKKLMELWDYEKNQSIDPATLTKDSQNKVWWKCPKCGYRMYYPVKYASKHKSDLCDACWEKAVDATIKDFFEHFSDEHED